jgi:CxxC motif-containing protein (DUF1111 family)
MRVLHVRKWLALAAVAAIAGLACWGGAAAKDDGGAERADQAAKVDGGELFNREWLPKDSRARGGDGLGPVFNDSSCVACHNQGGSGGGGPTSKNVDVISVFANPQTVVQSGPATLPEAMFRAMFGGFGGPNQTVQTTVEISKPGEVSSKESSKELAKQQKAALQKIHPGFVTARSVVLHKASTDPAYDTLRAQMRGEAHFVSDQAGTLAIVADAEVEGVQGVELDFSGDEPQAKVNVAKTDEGKAELQPAALIEAAAAQQTLHRHRNAIQQFRSPTQGTQAHIDNFLFVGSQRNPTALFGAGLIDSIPESVIRENASKTHKEFPEVQGRVAKLKDGRIGRFGWKNQTATLYDFAMTACAVELGLDVPGHPQAGAPHKPDYQSPGHDMNKAECDALVDFLKKLPAPKQAAPVNKQQAEYLAAGEAKFTAVGCATCHTKDMGDAKAIYSDLLLHDMGQDLGDSGSYGIFIPNSPEEGGEEPIPSLGQQQVAVFGMGAAAAQTKADREKIIGATRQEWRTPPLWGVRDSGPYLHDGRADSLEQAIALHGGEAARSAQRFFELSTAERLQVMAFLKSLGAPPTQVASR